MNSVASQSSSSGWTGNSPCAPKSSTVLTMPKPKYDCQKRFTATRAVSGLLRSTSQRARPSRSFDHSGARRSEHLRQPRRDLLTRSIVGPALQQERVARRGAVGHHHHAGNLGVELLALAPQRRQLIVRTRESRAAPRAPGNRLPDSRPVLPPRWRPPAGLQRPVVDADVLDRSGESQTAARANAQRRLRMMDRLRVLVEQNLHRHRLAIDDRCARPPPCARRRTSPSRAGAAAARRAPRSPREFPGPSSAGWMCTRILPSTR